MTNYHWQDHVQASLPDRFPPGVIGRNEWRLLVDQLQLYPPQQILAEFLDRTSRLPRASECCLFVSHRQSDVAIAERIAQLATQEHYDYWLDVHDPVLIYAPTLSSPLRELLIASIIEIALLNCTHVIGARTKDSIESKWMPYELGRAKQRLIYAHQAANWFEPGVTPNDCGEYTLLTVRTLKRADIERWLRSSKPYSGCICSTAKTWGRTNPPELPGS